MESQQSTQAPNDQIAELGQRMARMETRMEFVANREASMQRWLLGITATTVVGVSSAMAGVAAALIQAFG